MPSDNVLGGKKIPGTNTTFLPEGLTVDYKLQVGHVTSAVSGETVIMFIVAEADGTVRRYVLPPEEARAIAAELMRQADRITRND
jgi:hypothetical protein